ncbi:aldo/keto reductase [Paenibacillus lemnae]|uniref:Aldo/keto reductase n=1 Tax=Paenibacillus lemnae TaxID=1330551 RepID=A0A848M6V4_PAELE|nr:aldo/keto reductase [Paenibacillus lemnae]NMO96366.1 aldo/keto reductase [Paenibacillus lemnae]
MTNPKNPVFSDGPTLTDGTQMPWLGLGVYKTKEGEEVIQSVKAAIAAGYRSIDTAAIYGNEEGVGQAIRESGVPREELFITTKVWNDDQGYESTLKACETSLQKLGLDYLDLYLIHWPGKDKYKETWKALIQLKEQGLVRSIGVSNFQIHHLRDIIEDSGVVPTVNQVELHPLNTQKELLQYAREHSIVLEAWSPLMQGHLDQPVLSKLAEKYGKTAAQIILRWDLQNGIIVIPKSVKEHRIRENSDIFDFELSAEDMEVIDSLNQNKRFGSDPDEFLF